MNILNLKIVIENPKGSHKVFLTEDDPSYDKYPLKGVTYPVDYGFIDGYIGEDGHDLDVLVGTGNMFGYIRVWRLDVPEETKTFVNLTKEELESVFAVFKPVLLSSEVIAEEDFLGYIEKFKI